MTALDNAPRMATLIVLADPDGYVGRHIVRVASRHAAFDPDRRRVFRAADATNALATRLEIWRRETNAVAVMFNARGEACALLNERDAVNDARVEDAFVRGLRDRRMEPVLCG